MENNINITDQMVLFWDGWPSQWHPSSFVIDQVQYNCCEQYMMAEKARVFGDADALAKILAAKSPRVQKAIGRHVECFQPQVWEQVCRGVVYTGNLAKFRQNDPLRHHLLATGARLIVEASPEDRIWGIGLSQDDPRAQEPSQWQGKNWLGIALMQVRQTLQASEGSAEPVLEHDMRRQLMARAEMQSRK